MLNFLVRLARRPLVGLAMPITLVACSPPHATDVPLEADIVTVDHVGDVGSRASMLLDADGRLVISYYDASNEDLKLAVCDDAACAGASLTTVDGGHLMTGWESSLALDADGLPVVSYSASSEEELRLARCADPVCAEAAITALESGVLGLGHAMALDVSGHPVVSHFVSYLDPEKPHGQLRLLICTDPACSSPLVRPLDADGGSYNSLALTAEGHPVVSYFDDAERVLKLTVCHDPTCTDFTSRLVDTVTGTQTSLVLDARDHPVISYWDYDHGDLRLAVCHDPICEARTIRTVDSGGDVGHDSALVLDGAGNPVISYQKHLPDEHPHMALKLAVCHDPTCSRATIGLVARGGEAGSGTALALDGSGRPLIAYYDADGDNLKLARVR